MVVLYLILTVTVMSQSPVPPSSPKGDLPPGPPEVARVDVPPVEEDRRSRSSKRSARSKASSRSTSPKPIYKICSGCNKSNKLMATDLHDECMRCLGTDHLFRMKSCPACQALGYKDRLERARRFMYQRKMKVFLTARGMRRQLVDMEEIPEYLERAYLEPFFVVTGTSPPTTPSRDPSRSVSVPPERQESARRDDRSRSLLI